MKMPPLMGSRVRIEISQGKIEAVRVFRKGGGPWFSGICDSCGHETQFHESAIREIEVDLLRGKTWIKYGLPKTP